MTSGYQILDLKGYNLSSIDESHPLQLTDEQVQALKSKKPLLLENVSVTGYITRYNAIFVTNDDAEESLSIVCGNSMNGASVITLGYSLDDKEINSFDVDTIETELPEMPETIANKTYVLKLVNGSKTWVEEKE
jgi:hypothetical protein